MAEILGEAQQDLTVLKAELQKDSFDDVTIGKRLTNLKAVARNPQSASCVYCKEGLNVLAETAFGCKSESRPVAGLEAAGIIANALLLRDQMQQVFAVLDYTNQVVEFYGQQGVDHEFVGGRILFLLTYKSKVNFDILIESHQLVERIQARLSQHATSISAKTFASGSMNLMALTETLKLLYNLASKCSAQMHSFSKVVDCLITIVSTIPLPPGPLEPPITQLLNDLAIIEWQVSSSQTDENILLDFARRLIEIIDRSTASFRPAQLETMLVTLITATRKLYELPHAKAKQLLRSSLLPQDKERDKPLGQSDSLAARLLRLQTTGGLTVLPEAISGLLFDLSDRDATTFVHNIGYGHAAGYLMTHKIQVPPGLASTVDGGSLSRGEVEINPITGQRFDAETPINMPEMTDAEKENEAERLFVLFERLRATGVMDVENPLRTAQQSGRFEELPDSEPD